MILNELHDFVDDKTYSDISYALNTIRSVGIYNVPEENPYDEKETVSTVKYYIGKVSNSNYTKEKRVEYAIELYDYLIKKMIIYFK